MASISVASGADCNAQNMADCIAHVKDTWNSRWRDCYNESKRAEDVAGIRKSVNYWFHATNVVDWYGNTRFEKLIQWRDVEAEICNILCRELLGVTDTTGPVVIDGADALLKLLAEAQSGAASFKSTFASTIRQIQSGVADAQRQFEQARTAIHPVVKYIDSIPKKRVYARVEDLPFL